MTDEYVRQPVKEWCEIIAEKDAEIARLRERLEIDESHPYDGIHCRDETIRLLEKQIKSLKEKTQYWPDNAERDAVIRYLREENTRLRGAITDAIFEIDENCFQQASAVLHSGLNIPPEAFKLARAAFYEAEARRQSTDDALRAACLAMLKHWPGVTTDGCELHFSTARGAPVTTVKAYSVILPLHKENTND